VIFLRRPCPILFSGLANYRFPLMIGARDMAFPTAQMPSVSWLYGPSADFLLYFSFVGGSGLYGAGKPPPTWDGSAYAP